MDDHAVRPSALDEGYRAGKHTRRGIKLASKGAEKLAARAAGRAAGTAAVDAAGAAAGAEAGGAAASTAAAASAVALPLTVGVIAGKATSTAAGNSLESHVPTVEQMLAAVGRGRPLAQVSTDVSDWGLYTPLVEGRIDGARAMHHLYAQSGSEQFKNVLGKTLALGTGAGTVERTVSSRWRDNAKETLRRLPPQQRAAEWADLVASWRATRPTPSEAQISEAAKDFGLPVPALTRPRPALPHRTGGAPGWVAPMRQQLSAAPPEASGDLWNAHLYRALASGASPGQLFAASDWVDRPAPDANVWTGWVASELGAADAAGKAHMWAGLAEALTRADVPARLLAAAAAEAGVATRPIRVARGRVPSRGRDTAAPSFA